MTIIQVIMVTVQDITNLDILIKGLYKLKAFRSNPIPCHCMYICFACQIYTENKYVKANI